MQIVWYNRPPQEALFLMRIAFSIHRLSKHLPSFSVVSDPFDRMSRPCLSHRLLIVHLYTQLGMVSTEDSKSSRNVIVAPFALEALKQHRIHQLEAKLKAGALWQEHDYVFCTLLGRYLNPNHVVEEFKKVLKQAGLPSIRFHDLRHSAATLLLSLGIHPKVVQELLGHTQISMTMDIYSHVLPGMQQDAMSKLHDALKRKDDDDDNGGVVGATLPTKR